MYEFPAIFFARCWRTNSQLLRNEMYEIGGKLEEFLTVCDGHSFIYDIDINEITK